MGAENFIKNAKNIMDNDKGASEYSQFVEQLCWMVFLKLYENKEELWEFEDENYESIIPDHLKWHNWANCKTDDGKEKGDILTGDELLTFVNNELFPTLKNLEISSETPKRAAIVKYFFENSNNFMKNGVGLRQIINELNNIDFNELCVKEKFIIQFEEMLIKLQESKEKDIIFTPRVCTDFIIEMLNPQKGEKIGDFACGTGGFLISALKYIRKQIEFIDDVETLEQSLFGIEKKTLPYLLSILNLLLNNVDLPNIQYDNSLSHPVREFTQSDKFDIVVMNPPFGGSEDPSVKNNFPVEMRTSETADLFLALAFYRLKENGRCAIILPDGSLFGSEGANRVIKKKILQECNLHTILRLPKGVFRVATNILFFDKGTPTTEIWFYEHQVGYGTKTYSKTKPIRFQDLNPERNWWNNREESDFAWKVSIEEIVNNNFNIDFKNPLKNEEEVLSSSEYMSYLESTFNASKILLENMKVLLNK